MLNKLTYLRSSKYKMKCKKAHLICLHRKILNNGFIDIYGVRK